MNNEASLSKNLTQAFGEDRFERNGEPFALRVFPDGSEPVEKCVAMIGTVDDNLVVRAAAYDSFLHNNAVIDNEKTWQLGDVIEFFVQAPGHEDYYEFHVTPEAKRLQLHLLDYRTIKQVPWEEKLVDVGLNVRSSVFDGVWVSEMRLPFAAIGIASIRGIRYAVCRYNYPQAGDPERSSSMLTDEIYGFHNPPVWKCVY